MAPPLVTDLACAIHAHTIYSDGTGTVADVVRAARRNALDVLLLTDHNTLKAKSDEGWHEDLLLLVGEEISPYHRDHTLAFGHDKHVKYKGRPIAAAAAEAPLTFAAHPFSKGSPLWRRRFEGMPHTTPFADSIDGIEVWSYMTDAGEAAEGVGDIARLIARPGSGVESFPTANLIEWDRACARRRVVGIGGIDAHQVGLRVGGRVPIRAIGYKRTLRHLHTHVLCREAPTGDLAHDREQIYDALREGRCYIAIGSVAPARGFAYWGEGVEMGSEAAFDGQALHVRLPRPAEVRLVRNGETVAEEHAAALDHEPRRAGVYRVEARLGGRAWILSNPVYLR